MLFRSIKRYSFLTFFSFCSIKALKPGSWTYRLGEFADKINEYELEKLSPTHSSNLAHTLSLPLFLSLRLSQMYTLYLPSCHSPFVFFLFDLPRNALDVQQSQNILRPEIDGHSDGRTVRTIRPSLCPSISGLRKFCDCCTSSALRGKSKRKKTKGE